MAENKPKDATAKPAPVRPTNFKLDQHAYRRFRATVPELVEKPEDPELWVHVAPQLSPGDVLSVLAEDFSFYAELLVSFSQGSSVKLVPLMYKKLEPVDYTAQPVSDYEVKLRGPKKWCIVRISTGEVVKDSLPTQSAAYKELEEYLRALAA